MTATTYRPRTRRMAVAEILAEVATPTGETWPELLAALRADPYEAPTIAALADALRRDGEFREPLVVLDGVLSNGCHRLAAALDAGAEFLTVTTADRPAAPVIEVEVALSLSGAGSLDGALDALFGTLHSFPLDENTWVEADVLTVCAGVLNGTWRCPHDRRDDLVAALEQRLAAVRVSGRVLRASPQLISRMNGRIVPFLLASE